MKRIICLLLALILALPVFAASAEEVVTSITPPESTGEYENVLFSNGYHGFCMNQKLAGTINKNPFAIANSTDAASDVAQELKILFTQCFTDIFVSDGSGGYVLKKPNTILGVVYHFVHGNHPSGDIKTLSDKVKAYTGEPIPDSGYQLTLENGDTITFSFIVLCPLNIRADGKPYQDFFAYQITVSQEVPHEHDYSDDWKSDDDNHWHECDCGDKADLDEHDPIVVGKKEPSEFEEGYTGDTVCDDCGTELEKGQPIPPTHEHDYSDDWKSDDDNHWHECDCGDKADLDEHDPVVVGKKDPGEFQEGYTGDTVCDDCGKELEKGQPIPPTHEHDYSDDWKSDDDNHWHECDCGDKADLDEHDPIVVGKKEPTEFEEGYTGDTVCDDCGKELEKGQPIPPTHEHDYSDDWKSDDDNHWHECDCGDKADLDEHDPVVAGKKEPSEFEEGYTGDTVCDDCGKELEKGQPIPPTHEHDYSDDWKSDDDNHWHECDCGDKTDLDEHDPVVVGKKEPTEFEEGYTGDTICETCKKELKKGQIIPATHEHNYSDKWKTDKDNHWYECACGEKKDLDKHSFKSHSCSVCGIANPNYVSGSPNTGDHNNPALWLMLSLLSIGACAWIALYTRKNRIV